MKTKFLTLTLLALFLVACSSCSPGGGSPAPRPSPQSTALTAQQQDELDRLITNGKNLNMGEKFHEALNAFDEALKIDPRSLDALEGRTRALCNLKQWDDALRNLDYQLTIQPDAASRQWHAYLYRSIVNLNMGNMEKYMEDRKKAQSFTEFSTRTNQELARALSDKGMYDEALKLIDEALKMSLTPKEKSDIFNERAYLLQHKKDYFEAGRSARAALKTGINREQSYFILMRIYMDKNQNREALEMYREYRKLDPSEELVSRLNDRARAAHYATLGAIHRDVNQMGEADGFFRKALEIYPDNMDYHICRIQVLASQGDIGRAREAAVKWLALKPLKPFEAEECSSQSVAYAVLGDKEKALKYINVSIKKKPKKAIFWATRALIHYYNGDRESFEKDYNHFRSIAQAPEIEYMDTLIRNFKKGYRPAKVPD